MNQIRGFETETKASLIALLSPPCIMPLQEAQRAARTRESLRQLGAKKEPRVSRLLRCHMLP